MTKILFITNFSSKEEYVDYITSFSKASYESAQELGYEFHINTNRDEIVRDNQDESIHFHVIEVYRNPFSKEVIKGYKQLKKVIQEEKFDMIHCNTPIGGVLGRIVGSKCGVNKIIYQAHGFHFYKGAPRKNWLIYYPIEKWLAKKTDAIITINKEDYSLAKEKFHLKNNGEVYYVPGVGINLSEFNCKKELRNKIRSELSIQDDSVMLLSVGRLDVNKNNYSIIKALSHCKEKIHFVLCGEGTQRKQLEETAVELGLGEQIHFLGKRKDVSAIYSAADIFVMASLREGLSRSLMEAMASGLPCIVSSIRGNVDLIEEGVGGYLVNPYQFHYISSCIDQLASEKELRNTMGKNNLKKIQSFDCNIAKKTVTNIYRDVLNY